MPLTPEQLASRTPTRPYNLEERLRIEALKAEVNSASYHATVVDYLGFYDDEGWVTEDSGPLRRFGVRSAQHVAVYGFLAIYSKGKR